MTSADLKSFNDGFDHACKVISECNSNGRFNYITVVGLARGFRHDRWWREGTQAAIEWAQRNWKLNNSQLQGYRQ
jgi:hypothetical protein